jgi:hypothetical protein
VNPVAHHARSSHQASRKLFPLISLIYRVTPSRIRVSHSKFDQNVLDCCVDRARPRRRSNSQYESMLIEGPARLRWAAHGPKTHFKVKRIAGEGELKRACSARAPAQVAQAGSRRRQSSTASYTSRNVSSSSVSTLSAVRIGMTLSWTASRPQYSPSRGNSISVVLFIILVTP